MTIDIANTLSRVRSLMMEDLREKVIDILIYDRWTMIGQFLVEARIEGKNHNGKSSVSKLCAEVDS